MSQKIIKQNKQGEDPKQERSESAANNINNIINNQVERKAQVLTSTKLAEHKREEPSQNIEFFSISIEARTSDVIKFITRKFSYIVVEESHNPPLKHRVVFRDAEACNIEFVNIHTEEIKAIVYFA